VALQVLGRGHRDELQVADAPRHQRLVGQLAAADHAVHVVADQVHHAVAHAQVHLDVGVARMELGQVGQDEQLRHRRAHIHAQAPARVGAGVGHARLDVIEVGEQANGALVVGGAVRRHGDASRGAVEQLHAQALFQRLHMLGDRGLGQAQ